jgi:dUTPase
MDKVTKEDTGFSEVVDCESLSGGVKSKELEIKMLKYSSFKYILEIKIEKEYEELYNIDEYNTNVRGDSGINLIVPAVTVDSMGLYVIDHKVRCRMVNIKTGECVSYYMYPRSSLSKTGYLLANSVGVIDAGYRGPLIAKMSQQKVFVAPESLVKTSLFQICAPDLKPIFVRFVTHNFEDDPEVSNMRGAGGFGSTGKTVA